MRRANAFTLIELLVVVGLMAAFSFFIAGGLAGSGRTAALRSAQAMLVNLITTARTKAMASGLPARVLVHVDAASAGQPSRYLRYLAVQSQAATGWQTVTEVFLPEGVYVVPGNFTAIPAGLFAAGASAAWTKADGSPLLSTALRASQVTTETINGPVAEQWVSFTLAATAGTMQSGDIVLAAGRVRASGTHAAGDAPVELVHPETVRGLSLSVYGVPALINDRLSF